MMVENVIIVRDICKTFTTKADANHEKKLFSKSEKITRNVIENINLEIRRGEVFGVIGRNGSGKSTLLKMISMIMKPDSGTIDIKGRVASILELGMGFHQDLSGRENIYIKGSMYGFTKQQIDDRVDDIIKYAELEDYIDLPIRVYSSGMTSRLAFAIMINVDADVMILDEVLSTGDLSFSKKSGAHFSNMKSTGKTIIIVSHAMGTMRDMCDRVAWIDGGKIREIGAPNVVCGHYETELAESFEVIKELAESGVPVSQNALGCMYRDGIKVEKNTEHARAWFEKAAGYGNEEAKINLADMFIAEGKPEYRERALDLYMSAARKGNRDARNKLSRLLTQEKSDIGREVAEDFMKLLSPGNPILYYDYAELIMKTAWNNDGRSGALEWFQKSADYGNVNAMYQISIMYRDGNGPKKDTSKHLEWLKKAAENGHILSQLTLGNMYRDGIRVESDESEAFRWYEMAAKNNNLDAIYQVATMYREGKGVDQSREESDCWLQLYSKHDLLRQINILADSFSHCKNGVYDPEIGMKWYSVSAEHNNAESMYQMGMMLTEGEWADETASEAVYLLSSAADNGHLNSAVRLSNLYELGLSQNSMIEKAINIIDKLAKGGNAWAAFTIGNMYANGNMVEVDGSKAVEYLKIAASSSIPGAMQKLGEIFRDGMLVEQDFKEAVIWFEEGIISGNVGSAISLINMYGAGNVGEEVLNHALKSLKEMCLRGNVFAMKTLGNYYLNGIVVEADAEKAFYWYTKASKFGDSPSMHIVGEMYRDGRGTDKNEAEALKCFMFAAKQGNVNSMLSIIRMQDAGQADSDAFEYALRRLEQVAEGGNVIAIRTLGNMHLEGKSVPKDIEEAKRWFEKSAKLGCAFSRNKLKSLE